MHFSAFKYELDSIILIFFFWGGGGGEIQGRGFYAIAGSNGNFYFPQEILERQRLVFYNFVSVCACKHSNVKGKSWSKMYGTNSQLRTRNGYHSILWKCG